MTRDQTHFMEGFTCGLTCQGTICDYKRDSKAWENWWKGHARAKALGADGADKVLAKLYWEHVE